MRARCAVAILFLCLGGTAPAQPPLHTIVFNTSSNAGAGNAVYVAVDRPELGGLTTTGSTRMVSTGANQWTARIAVRGSAAETNVNHQFMARTTSRETHCTVGNGSLAGATITTNVPLWEPGYAGKTVYYHTTWTNVTVFYRVGLTDAWTDSAVMTRLGDGRTTGEHLYKVEAVGVAGEPLEFVMRGYNGSGQLQYDNAPYGGYGANNYYTWLDTFFLQDGHVFNYFPPGTVSAPQMITVNSWPSSYTGNGIASRGGRVYLPRGYAQNTTKRYPVLYMHDGQNVFDPGGPFGSWSADAAATREISQGRMRETIIVAVNNTNNRNNEYSPGPGLDANRVGDYYLLYVVNNIRPSINGSYRTLTNFMDTGVMGSSLGGLISAYFGLSTNVFGLIGAVSPSYWYNSGFRNWIDNNPTKGNRIYQDAGTGEPGDMWTYFWPVYEYYIKDDYTVNDDIQIVIGCGHGHNEAAWAARVGGAFQYLYNPWDEPNLLETNVAPSAGTLQFDAASYSASETAGTVRVYVSRLGGSDGAASANYVTSNGTAIADADFIAVGGALNWTNGDTAVKFFDVPILDNEVFGGDKWFHAVLTNITGAATGAPPVTVVTILDDEPPPPDLVITNPANHIAVDYPTDSFDMAGLAHPFKWNAIHWTNQLTGGSGSIGIQNPWAISGIPLDVGDNVITVLATNIAFSTTTNAADSGASAVYGDEWDVTDNGGFGFSGWEFNTSSGNGDHNGRFMATSPAVDIGTPAWGLYANSGNLSEVRRVLSSALQVDQTFHVRFDNGFITNAASVGVALQNSENGTLWEFYFIGGEPYYRINGGGTTDVGWTSTGIDLEVTLTGPTNYSMTIHPAGGEPRTISGNLMSGPNASITRFRAWNFNAGAGSDFDFFFNEMRITSVDSVSSSTGVTAVITREPEFHDGIPMTWWNAHGMGTNSAAAADDDGDGSTNWEEYVGDTDPTSGASVYTNRIAQAFLDGVDVMVLRAGPPTTNSRVYDVYFGTNLVSGEWAWLNRNVPGAANGGPVFLSVTNTGDAGYYRTGVKIP